MCTEEALGLLSALEALAGPRAIHRAELLVAALLCVVSRAQDALGLGPLAARRLLGLGVTGGVGLALQATFLRGNQSFRLKP